MIALTIETDRLQIETEIRVAKNYHENWTSSTTLDWPLLNKDYMLISIGSQARNHRKIQSLIALLDWRPEVNVKFDKCDYSYGLLGENAWVDS